MKLSDAPSVATSTVIAASLTTVWLVVTDLNAPAAFSGEFDGAEWIGDSPVGVGATFVGRNHRGENSWTTTSTVTAWLPNALFTYVVGSIDEPLAIWSYAMHREGDATRLTFTASVGRGPSGLSRAVEANPDREEEIVASRLALWRDNMSATLAGMKSLAEAM
jgi:hypothetical protein